MAAATRFVVRPARLRTAEPSANQRVSPRQDRLRDGQPERLGCLHVDLQVVAVRADDRHVRWLRPAQDSIDVFDPTPGKQLNLRIGNSERQQAARLHKLDSLEMRSASADGGRIESPPVWPNRRGNRPRLGPGPAMSPHRRALCRYRLRQSRGRCASRTAFAQRQWRAMRRRHSEYRRLLSPRSFRLPTTSKGALPTGRSSSGIAVASLPGPAREPG